MDMIERNLCMFIMKLQQGKGEFVEKKADMFSLGILFRNEKTIPNTQSPKNMSGGGRGK